MRNYFDLFSFIMIIKGFLNIFSDKIHFFKKIVSYLMSNIFATSAKVGRNESSCEPLHCCITDKSNLQTNQRHTHNKK